MHRDSSVSPNSCEFNPDHQLFSSAPWFTVSAAVCLLHCDSASVPVQRFSPDSNTFSNDALVPVPELLLMPWFGALRGPRGGVGRSDVSLGGELSDAAGRPSVPAVIRMHSSPTRLSLSLSVAPWWFARLRSVSPTVHMMNVVLCCLSVSVPLPSSLTLPPPLT